jgi:tRNA A37 threonylcarbamoyladenosine biosynthesis protein TsaE
MVYGLAKKNNVLEWNIRQYIHQHNITVAEWYFKWSGNGTAEAFNDVSIIEFTEEDKRISIKGRTLFAV